MIPTLKLSISQSTHFLPPNKKIWLETEQDSTPTPTSRHNDPGTPKSSLKLSIDLSSINNNPPEKARMVLVKNKLLKLSNDLQKRISSPGTQSTRYTFQQTPLHSEYSFDITPKSARHDGSASNGFSIFRRANAQSQVSNLNLKEVDSFYKALVGEHTRQESEDYKLKRKKAVLSQEAEKFKQIIGQCDNLNKEVGRFEKQVQNTESEYNKQVNKIQQVKQVRTKTKDFWKNDPNFLLQRANMRTEIENFKNQIREQEETTAKKKREARLTEASPNAKSDVSDEEEHAPVEDNIAKMLLKTPKTTRESRKFVFFVHKSKFSQDQKLGDHLSPSETKEDLTKSQVSQPPQSGGIYQNYFNVIGPHQSGDQNKEGNALSKKSKKKKLVLKKLDKIGQLNKIDFDYDMKTEIPMRAVKSTRSQKSSDHLSYMPKFDHLQDATENVANADIKRRQKAFLAQFKKDRQKSHIKDDFTAFKTSSYTQRERLHTSHK